MKENFQRKEKLQCNTEILQPILCIYYTIHIQTTLISRVTTGPHYLVFLFCNGITLSCSHATSRLSVTFTNNTVLTTHKLKTSAHVSLHRSKHNCYPKARMINRCRLPPQGLTGKAVLPRLHCCHK